MRTINPNNEKLQVRPQKRRIMNPQIWAKANPEFEVLERNDLIEEAPYAMTPPANIVLGFIPPELSLLNL